MMNSGENHASLLTRRKLLLNGAMATVGFGLIGEAGAQEATGGTQPGDPAKAGKAIADFLTVTEPPLHLLLGSDAFEYVQREFEALRSEFTAWEAVSRSTNFGQSD